MSIPPPDSHTPSIHMPMAQAVRPPEFSNSSAARLVAELRHLDPRRRLQRRRWDILNDNGGAHLDAEIDHRFQQPANRDHLKMFKDMSNNSLTAIVDKVSTVFKEPARREFKKKADTALYQQVVNVAELDMIMEEVNRITMGCNECAVMPVIREPGQVDFDIIRADQVAVASVGRRMKAIAWPVENGFWYMDRVIQQGFDEQGNAIGAAELHPWWRIPITWYRRRVPTEGFFLGTAGESLVSLWIDQVILRSWINATAYYQSHKELAKKPTAEAQATGLVQSTRPAGPHAILEGDYSVLDMRTDVRPLIEAVEAKLRRAAANWGVSSEALNQSKFGSGLEKLMSQSGLNEVRMATIKLFRPADLELMLNVAMVWNCSGQGERFSLESKLKPRIDYGEPRLIESTKESQETLDKGMSLGVSSPVDHVMAHDPDLKNREEAKARIKRNLEESNEVLEARRKFSQPEEDAAAQGILGGKASGAARQVQPPEWEANEEGEQ